MTEIETTIAQGLGGWFRFDDVHLPGPLYVRFTEINGTPEVTELYLDGRGKRIAGEFLRKLNLQRLRALAFSGGALSLTTFSPASALSVLASYFATTFGNPLHSRIKDRQQPREVSWVGRAYLEQIPDSGFKPVGRARERGVLEYPDVPPLTGPDEDGRLTDAFLTRVAEAWYAKVARGSKHPAKDLAAEVGGDPTSATRNVHRWVYLARQRGLMEKTRQGAKS